jgi:hypothetical protein
MFGKKKPEPSSQPTKMSVDIEFQLKSENMLAPKHVVHVTMEAGETRDLARLRDKAAWAENRDPSQVEVTKWRINGKA